MTHKHRKKCDTHKKEKEKKEKKDRTSRHPYHPEDQYHLKTQLACKTKKCSIHLRNNGDLDKIPQSRANFSKSLPHSNGIVDPGEYKKLVEAIYNNCPKRITKVKLGTPNGLKLTDPSNVFDLEVISKYKGCYDFPLSPKIKSDEAAGEMVELYEMVRARDIPFINYGTNLQITQAAANLSTLTNFKGPKVGGQVTPATIFRGQAQGDLKGPYVSQFLFYQVNAGFYSFEQKYASPPVGDDYITTVSQFVNVWNGNVTQTQAVPGPKRYITTLRDGTRLVHYDEPGQIYQNALRILWSLKVPLDSGIPYVNGTIPNQIPFVSLGVADILDLLGRACKLGLDAAWFNKWTQLRLRPEEFGYQLQLYKEGNTTISFSKQILDNQVLTQNFNQYGTYLLPQTYAEGSPTHPAYPAGHAVISGACVTILKAFFDNDFEFPQSYIASVDGSSLISVVATLKVGEELNKLASNVSIFRNGAGVHYRSDALGMWLGEQVAFYLLEQYIERYQVPVTLSFKSLEGKTIRISNSSCESD